MSYLKWKVAEMLHDGYSADKIKNYLNDCLIFHQSNNKKWINKQVELIIENKNLNII